MSVVQNIECCWIFSIFGRNSWVLKVLAHKKSDEIQKKLKSIIFMAWWRDVLIKHSHDDCCAKELVFLEIFNFWSKFMSFKGVSPRKEWRNPKNLKILIFLAWRKGILIKMLRMNVVQKNWCFWKFSIFGRNSCVLKVLGNGKTDEIQKNWNL